jgi:hypothetical protein
LHAKIFGVEALKQGELLHLAVARGDAGVELAMACSRFSRAAIVATDKGQGLNSPIAPKRFFNALRTTRSTTTFSDPRTGGAI